MTTTNDPFPNKDNKATEFAKADMTDSHFNGVNLSNAKFWAVLTGALFKDCNMADCEFDDVNLGQARFNNINLSNAEFSNMNLSGAKFSGLNMTNVEISDVNIQGMKINGILVSDLLENYEK